MRRNVEYDTQRSEKALIVEYAAWFKQTHWILFYLDDAKAFFFEQLRPLFLGQGPRINFDRLREVPLNAAFCLVRNIVRSKPELVYAVKAAFFQDTESFPDDLRFSMIRLHRQHRFAIDLVNRIRVQGRVCRTRVDYLSILAVHNALQIPCGGLVKLDAGI